MRHRGNALINGGFSALLPWDSVAELIVLPIGVHRRLRFT
jgi:hypothetical protein